MLTSLLFFVLLGATLSLLAWSGTEIFGDQEDPNAPISKILATQKSFRLQEDKGTKPNVHYVGKYSARA